LEEIIVAMGKAGVKMSDLVEKYPYFDINESIAKRNVQRLVWDFSRFTQCAPDHEVDEYDVSPDMFESVKHLLAVPDSIQHMNVFRMLKGVDHSKYANYLVNALSFASGGLYPHHDAGVDTLAFFDGCTPNDYSTAQSYRCDAGESVPESCRTFTMVGNDGIQIALFDMECDKKHCRTLAHPPKVYLPADDTLVEPTEQEPLQKQELVEVEGEGEGEEDDVSMREQSLSELQVEENRKRMEKSQTRAAQLLLQMNQIQETSSMFAPVSMQEKITSITSTDVNRAVVDVSDIGGKVDSYVYTGTGVERTMYTTMVSYVNGE